MDREPGGTGPGRARHVSQRPACRAALVPRPRHGRDPLQRVRRARRVMDRPGRPRARARPARGTALRAAAADHRPQLRRRPRRQPERRAGPQDRPRGDGMLQPVHRRQRRRLAGGRGRADHLPVPGPERLKRPHVPARPHPRRRSRPRSDHPDRQRGRASARADAATAPGTRAGLSRTGRPARRLLGPGPGHRAHALEHRRRALRRDLRRPGHGRHGRPRRAVALPGGAAGPCRRRAAAARVDRPRRCSPPTSSA